MYSLDWQAKKMLILGLTGSIAMGKTDAAKAFRQLGIQVHDADKIVHRLMETGGLAVKPIRELFPEAVQNDRIDRVALGQQVFDGPGGLRRLEAILHPLVHVAERQFLSAAVRRGDRMVVLDIPLLFETDGDHRCDLVAVVSAPARIQRIRGLNRPGMTVDRLSKILARQMPDAEKCGRADFIIPTGLGHAFSLRVIKNIVKVAQSASARKWGPAYGR
jgi:dephospho-CoA kinase